MTGGKVLDTMVMYFHEMISYFTFFNNSTGQREGQEVVRSMTTMRLFYDYVRGRRIHRRILCIYQIVVRLNLHEDMIDKYDRSP